MQRNLLARFHVTEPERVLLRAGLLAGARTTRTPRTPGSKQPPYYLLTQLPGQDEPTFQLTSAVTPNGRQNLAALVSGSYVEGKPQLEVLELPDQTVGLRPGPGPSDR